PWHQTLQGVRGVGGVSFHQVVAFHTMNRTSKVHSSLGAVTYHDHFVERLVVARQRNVELRFEPTATSWVIKPTKEKTSTSEGSARRVSLPSRPVVTPRWVPFTRMLPPIRGSQLSSRRTP